MSINSLFARLLLDKKESFTMLRYFPNAKVQQKVYSDNYLGRKRNISSDSLRDIA